MALLRKRKKEQVSLLKKGGDDVSETEKTNEIREELKDSKPFVWQEFDWNHDGELQRKELAGLIESLKKCPKALTNKEGTEGTHPAIRDRILFIANLYADVFEDSAT